MMATSGWTVVPNVLKFLKFNPYVCDIRNGTVTVLDLRERQTRVLRTRGLGGLVQPTDVAIADDGMIYVGDLQRGVVFVFDPEERHVNTLGHEGLNGADVAGTTPQLRTTQKLQAHIPLLLHPNPKLVMQVGLGSGETAHSILHHPIDRLDGIDISPEVIEAGPHFDELNRAVYEDPRVRIIIEDAKNYAASTTERYDLIFGDVFRGRQTVPPHLATREFFDLVKRRLRDEGVYMMNLMGALEGPRSRLFASVRATIRDVFPEVYVFAVDPNVPVAQPIPRLSAWADDQELCSVAKRY